MSDALLQFAGRLHPAVLHVPIGLLIGLAAFEALAALRGRTVPRTLRGPIVWLAAASATVAVASGLLLAREGDPATAVLRAHKWLGIAVGGGCVLAALVQPRGGGGAAYRALMLLTIIALVAGGHLGASMTHGSDFLLAPLRATGPAPSATDVPAGAAILAARCGGCHGGPRPKGGLVLTDAAGALRGGVAGPALVPGDAGASVLVQRLRLPLDDEDHMPPAHKPQLAPEEIRTVVAWIDAGAPSAPSAVTPTAPPGAPEPDTGALAALAAALVHVQRVEAGAPWLLVDASAVASGFDDAQASELLAPLRAQIVDLTLARSGIGDSSIGLFAAMPNLRRIDLTATAVTDVGLRGLSTHPRIEEIVLCRTAVGDGAVDALAAMPSLRRVYTWGSAMSTEGVAALRERRRDLDVDDGRALRTALVEEEGEIALTRPVSPLAPVNSTCPVTAAPVDARYTIVHEGKVIGFCCDQCPSTFWADPGSFEVKEQR